jgi:hypothetical protein
VAFDQHCKSQLGGLTALEIEHLEQLAVRQPADRTDAEECMNLPNGGSMRTGRHAVDPWTVWFFSILAK